MIVNKEKRSEKVSQSGLRTIYDSIDISSNFKIELEKNVNNNERESKYKNIKKSNESKIQFTNILDNSDEVIIAMDEEQVIRYFNKGAEKTFMHDPEDLIGNDISVLFPKRFSSNHTEHVKVFAKSPDIARRKNERTEIIGLRKDGTEFPAEASISKTSNNGKLVFSIFLRDITKRKKIEADLFRERNNLIRVNKALIKANEKKEHLSIQLINAEKFAALGEMAAKISHEINNHLSIITAEAGIQLQENLGDDLKDSFDNITESAFEIEKLARNYMVLAKPYKIKMKSLNLGDVLQQSVKSIKSLGCFNNIEVISNYVEKELPILGDKQLLCQVFRNLIINAVHATSEISKRKIGVETRMSDDGSNMNAIISDNGVGINPEDLDKIFDQYFSTKSKSEGTGLGLAIVKEIVEEKHKGKIIVESSPGEGTHFHVMIPIFEAENK